MSKVRMVVLVVVVAVLAGGVAIVLLKPGQVAKVVQMLPTPVPPKKNNIFDGVGYVAVDTSKFTVSKFADGLKSPTRIKITSDGAHMLVAQLTGEVMVFDRMGTGWATKPYQLLKIDTRFPGFPPDEAGLTGLVFSGQWETNHKLFLLYTYKDEQKNIQNRISVTTVAEQNGKLVATAPQQIWQANTPGNVSHQITDGVGVSVLNKPYLLVLIGEGFTATRAQNPAIEGGKVLLIGEGGGDPVGTRPWLEQPKIAAIGLRNGYVLARNIFENDGRFLLADTGPDHFDRIIYTKLVHPLGRGLKQVDLGWTGDEQALQKPIQDPNFPLVHDMVLTRLPDSLAITGLVFYGQGHGEIKATGGVETNVFATVFGKTGSSQNTPGKEIWWGKFNFSGQPKIVWETVVKRNSQAEGKQGNPIGLEVDSQNGDLYFGDIFEGRIYRIEVINK